MWPDEYFPTVLVLQIKKIGYCNVKRISRLGRLTYYFRRPDGASDGTGAVRRCRPSLPEVPTRSAMDAPAADRHRKRVDELHFDQGGGDVAGGEIYRHARYGNFFLIVRYYSSVGRKSVRM